jgi:hypothetical protein
MTERYGSDPDEAGGRRPSGRGSVTERLARPRGGAHEIDLTDDTEDRRAEREASGSFEPVAAAAGSTRPGSASIFDTGERAKQEDQAPTGYEPPVAEATLREQPGQEPPGQAPIGQEPTGPGPPGASEPPAADAAAPAPAGPPASLLGSLDAEDIRNRFLDIQAGFVDEPRQAVEQAGRFVDDLVRQVVDALQGQRGQLTGTPAEGSTEDLRLALRAYRQFVDRLLGLAG